MKRKNLVGFAIVVFLVVAYAGYDHWSSQEQEKKKSQQLSLWNGDIEQVQKMDLTISGSEIQLEKGVDGWKMTAPVQDSANTNLIEQYIDGISTENAQETVVEGGQIDFAAFGLDHPKGVITLTLNSGETTKFSIGQLKNFQGDAFLRKNDENKVMVVSSTWLSKIEKTALDFRDKRVMRRSNAKTEKISFQKGGNKFDLEKKDGQWIVVGHPEWKLDQNKVREIMAELNSTEALEFIAENNATPSELKNWGFDKPALRIQVTAAADTGLKPWIAEFAAGADKVYRVRTNEPPLVMKIAPTDLGKFQVVSLDTFRDRSEPFLFDRSKVRQIEVKLGKETFNLNVDEGRAKDLLNQFDKIKVAEFSMPKIAQLDQTILFKDESGKEVFSFQWGSLHSVSSPQGNKSVFAAKTTSFPNGFTISETDISLLNLNELTKDNSKKESVQ